MKKRNNNFHRLEVRNHNFLLYDLIDFPVSSFAGKRVEKCLHYNRVIMYASQCLATNTHFPDLDEHINVWGKTDLNGVGKGEKFSYLRKNSTFVWVREKFSERKGFSERQPMWTSANTSLMKIPTRKFKHGHNKSHIVHSRAHCVLFSVYFLLRGVGSLEYIELWYSINFRKEGRDNNKKACFRTRRMWNFPSVFCYDFSIAHTTEHFLKGKIFIFTNTDWFLYKVEFLYEGWSW